MKPGTLEWALHLALRHGDPEWVELVRVALVERWGAMAWQQARKWYFRNRRGELDDYRSAAQVGLWDAAVRFDPTKGVGYSTYAGWYLIKYLRPHAHHEAAGGFHVPCHHGFVHVAATPFGGLGEEGDGTDFAGSVPARETDPREEPPDAAAVWAAVERVLAGRPRELLVLRLRYREGWTLKAVADHLSRSRELVRQIEARAVGRLRDKGRLFAGFLDLEGAA